MTTTSAPDAAPVASSRRRRPRFSPLAIPVLVYVLAFFLVPFGIVIFQSARTAAGEQRTISAASVLAFANSSSRSSASSWTSPTV